MTEKRFEFRLCSDELYYFYIIDNETGKEYKYLIDDEFLKLLNELHDENEQLKERLKLVRKDLTHIMLLLLDDEIVKQLSDYEIKVFERLSKV